MQPAKVFTLFLLIFFISSPAYSGGITLESYKGHKVKLKWRQKTKKQESTVKLGGAIKGGERCKSMRVKVALRSSSTGSLAWFETNLKHYNPKNWNSFKAGDKVFSVEKRDKSSWEFDDIYFNCFN